MSSRFRMLPARCERMVDKRPIRESLRIAKVARPSRDRADADDVALLLAVAGGDRDAYAMLYHRHSAALLGLLFQILRSRAEAEDVLQEVFLQVWRQAGDFDAERGKPAVWLVMLARSRALDRLETIAARRRTLNRSSDAISESAPDAAEHAIWAEDRSRLVEALADIPDAQREVILLAYFGGLSQTEVAVRLDKPLGTVKSLARLGLEKLRRRLRLRNEDVR